MANNGREEWVRQLRRMADPVLEALRQRVLKQAMPVESAAPRSDCTHMEAFGRLLCGIAPWLELGPDGSAEGALRRRYAELTLEAVAAAVDPASPDYLWAPPDEPKPNLQLLVDTAFFAHALVRAPRRLIGGMTPELRKLTADLLIRSRVITPGPNNWLLFSAMVEAALRKMGFPADSTRMAYALRQHDQWFKGDGVYGDGRNFAFDYYNSFVIQPMMLDVVETIAGDAEEWELLRSRVLRRMRRYAAIQERLIAPDGSFPAVGRSIAYRCGAFQALAAIALRRNCRRSCIRPPSARRFPPSSPARWMPPGPGMKTAGSGSASAATSRDSARYTFRPAASTWLRRPSCRSVCRRATNSGAPRPNRGAP